MARSIDQEPIPQTDSIEELARFWDTHSLADYDDEVEEAVEFAFDLPRSVVQAIRQAARARGVAERELVREWVLEKFNATRK